VGGVTEDGGKEIEGILIVLLIPSVKEMWVDVND
jgi:hypothetical protein